MMRQAGRYLPEFIALRDKYDFFTRCQTPELAAEITVQPIRRIAPDAAILFSYISDSASHGNRSIDETKFWSFFTKSYSHDSRRRVIVPDVHETLGYVFDAIKLTKEMLDDEVPLIGFAGSPWTIMYAVEGQGSKSFDKAKGFCLAIQKRSRFIAKNTDTTILYLQEK
jgi:uroporphyrinogen decarboxylase